MNASWQESYDKPRQYVQKQRFCFHIASKGQYSQGYGLSSSHAQTWELDNKEGRVPKNWCFRTMVPEKTLESPLESKEIKLVNLKGNQPLILFVRTVAEAEAPILWTPDVNSWLIGKDPDAGKDWRQKDKRVTKDKMVGWHHQFNGHELGQTLGDGEGWGNLACYSPWGHEDLNMTWWLTNNNLAKSSGSGSILKLDLKINYNKSDQYYGKGNHST